MAWIPWLALPLELLHVAAALASGNVASAGTDDRVAVHIRQGINSKDGPARDTNSDGSLNASTTSTISQSVVTGSGPSFASSCQAALWSWKEASESYGSQHEYLTTYTTPGSVYATYTYTDFTAGVEATRLTTLCDGYPRVIGSANYSEISTSTISYTPYAITTSLPGPFTTPMPCSIGPSDCAALWRSFASSTSASLVFENKTALEPPCQTATGNTTIPFATAACTDDSGTGPGIIGSEIRLLYWPVRSAVASSPDPYLCSSYNKEKITPAYIPGTRASDGPKTFVTGDLTITSPAVAISFSGLHRLDGCGPTINSTIITLQPSQLSSVRGARAAYDWYPFNLADLNWRCESPSGVFTLQDTNETTNGADCYQDVAAQAYWGAAPQVDYARGITTSLTIVNDYRPYVIPNQSVGTEMLHSLWGTMAYWWIDGIWDPPLALTEASHEAVPTLPGGGNASPTTTPSQSQVLTTPAAPGQTTPSGAVPTALPDSESNTPSSGSAGAQPSKESDIPAPSGTDLPGSQGTTSVTMSQEVQSQDPLPATDGMGTISDTQSQPANSPAVSSDMASSGPDLQPVIVMIPGKSTEVYWQSETLDIGGPAHTIDGQVASAATEGLVIAPDEATGAAVTTIPYSTRKSDASGIMSAAGPSEASNNQGGQETAPTSRSGSGSFEGGGTSSSGSASTTDSTALPAGSSAMRLKTLMWVHVILIVMGLFVWL